jgi:type I restriction enzyme, S subunit
MLGDACEINPVKAPQGSLPADAPVTFVPMPAVDADEGVITTPLTRRFSEVRKGFTSFRENDVIMAKITPCMENGKAAIARNLMNGLGFGSTEFHVLRSTGVVLPEFVYHFIRQESYRMAAEAEMTGSVGQKRVPQSFLETTEMRLPPLPEQIRIVKSLTKLLNAVKASDEKLSEVPTILKRFRQSVLAAAYSGRLTEDWRELHGGKESGAFLRQEVATKRVKAWESVQSTKQRKRRYLEPIPLDEAELPEIPETWTWVSADEVCSQITDGEHVQPRYKPAGLPMLTATHVRDGFVEFKNVGLISEEDFRRCLERCAPTKDDILIVSVGATTGRAAIVEEGEPFAMVRSVLMLRPLIKARFLLRWIQSRWCQTWISQASGASAQPHFYIHDNKRMPVPLPPTSEQAEIVRRVEMLFTLADSVNQRVFRATLLSEQLIQSILAKAFRGELVPTEAELARREGREYEPASVLLERIKKERNSGTPSQVTRPRTRTAGALASAKGKA